MFHSDLSNIDFDVYEPRNPKASAYYQRVESHFEDLENLWEDLYERRFGFFRHHVRSVILKYLNCGDLHCGFARVRCENCGHEYILAYSCKVKNFCPACHQKRVVEFGEYLCKDILKDVPHRHWVFSIPKRLRIYFLYDRSLLAELNLCAWKVIKDYLKLTVPHDDAVPGAVLSTHTFGDFLNFHPHLHVLISDGCFYGNGSFMLCPFPSGKDLEEPFRYEVLKMLKKRAKSPMRSLKT